MTYYQPTKKCLSAVLLLFLSLTDYEPVWAETTVPTAITCNVNHEPFSEESLI
jgi:hypothetical protein